MIATWRRRSGPSRVAVVEPPGDTHRRAPSIRDLPAAVEVAAYHIVSEALANVVRHAMATEAAVRLSVGDALEMEVADDGIGVGDGRSTGTGMASIKERAAEVGGCVHHRSGPAWWHCRTRLAACRAVTEPLRVVIADDHPIFRDGLRAALGGAGVDVVGEAATGPEAVAQAADLVPDVVLMDLHMPGGGFDATRAIVAANPNIAVLVLTMSDDDHAIHAAVRAGPAGIS